MLAIDELADDIKLDDGENEDGDGNGPAAGRGALGLSSLGRADMPVMTSCPGLVESPSGPSELAAAAIPGDGSGLASVAARAGGVATRGSLGGGVG